MIANLRAKCQGIALDIISKPWGFFLGFGIGFAAGKVL